MLFAISILIFNLGVCALYYFFKAPLVDTECKYYKQKDLYFKFIIIIWPIFIYNTILVRSLIPHIRGNYDFIGVLFVLVVSSIFTVLYSLLMTMILDYLEEEGKKNIKKLTAAFVWDAADATIYIMDIAVYVNILSYWAFYKYFDVDYGGISSLPQVFILYFLFINFISIYAYSKYVSSGTFRKYKRRKLFNYYSRFILIFVPVFILYKYYMPLGIYFLNSGRIHYYYIYNIFVLMILLLYIVTMHLVYDYFTNKHSGDYYKLNRKEKQKFGDMAKILMLLSIIFNFMCFVCA